MGYNYPGQPVLGPLLMTGYGSAVVLPGLRGLQIESVWTAAYLHALNNQAMSFFMAALVTPVSMAVSWHRPPGLALCAGHPADPARPDLERAGIRGHCLSDRPDIESG